MMQNKILTIFLLISIYFTTIVYSAFDTRLQIEGDAVVRTDQSIRITSLEITNRTNDAYEEYNSKYGKDTTSMYLILPANSSIIYQVTITNKVSDSYLIDSIEEISNTNNNIDIDLSLNINDIVNGNSTKIFTITITNDTDSVQNETLVIEYGFKLNNFTVTFDANGGNVGTSSKTVSYGSNYGTLPTPTRAGYKFLGWNGSNMINIDNDESLPSSIAFSYREKRTFIPNSHVFGLAYNNYYNNISIIKESYTKTENQISFSKTPGYGIAYPFISDAGKIYTISYETLGGMMSVMYYKNDGTIITYDLKNEQGKNNYTFTTFPNTYYLVIALVSDGDNNPEFKNIKLVEGDIVTEYKPYYITSSTTVVQPNNHTLTAIWKENEEHEVFENILLKANNKQDGVYFFDEDGNLDYGDNSTKILLDNPNNQIKGNVSIWNNQAIYVCINKDNETYEYNLSTKKYTSRTMPCLTNRYDNLFINGDLSYGDNTNFESVGTYNTDGYISKTTSQSYWTTSTDYIPIDPNKYYQILMNIRSSNTTASYYLGIAEYDVDLNSITDSSVNYVGNTVTTLARDLNKNDEYMYLNDISNWNIDAELPYYMKGFILWNYKDSTGYQYSENTYSRYTFYNTLDFTNIDMINNVIKLNTSWVGKTIPAGTKLSQSSGGSTYNYAITGGRILSTDWHTYSRTLSGYNTNNNSLAKFRPGTKFIRILFGYNYYSTPNTITDIKSVSVKEL